MNGTSKPVPDLPSRAALLRLVRLHARQALRGARAEGEKVRAKKPPTQDEVNEYLDDLRESGVTNMFSAAPWIRRAFGVDHDAARSMLSEWMRTFSARHPRPKVEASK